MRVPVAYGDDQAADAEQDGEQAEQADPLVRDDRQAERGQAGNDQQDGDAQVLSGPDLPGLG
ncbi:hypothetical protein Acor_78870 [Acrocarpospora corrugata]|uniref:Uncharacterized protein n=1 Tax=Acrocarpospora corrugata TaxID=35763 RepID=A0A5M3WHK7_9ACTN|nr:hypothetical protein Acor_78870 [Acrocarpospora corrugata]